MDIQQYIKYPTPESVDFENYLKTYPDLDTICHGSTYRAQQHWLRYGRHEGRNIKLKGINYNNIINYIKSESGDTYIGQNYNNITLTTTLYNESDPTRIKELCICLASNISKSYIHSINVYYDISTGGVPDEFEQYFNNDKVNIIPFEGRPSYDVLLYKTPYKDVHIVCNGDIVITNDITKITREQLDNTVMCLTRWEFISDNDTSIFHANGNINTISQDTWIHDTTLPHIHELEKVYIGTNACDCLVGNILREHNVNTVNPCIDIKTIHVHLQNNRSNTSDTQHLSNDLFEGEWPRVKYIALSEV